MPPKFLPGQKLKSIASVAKIIALYFWLSKKNWLLVKDQRVNPCRGLALKIVFALCFKS